MFSFKTPPERVPPGTQYKVVEVQTPRLQTPVLTRELQESLASLPGNPGFQYLLSKFVAYKAALRAKLETDRHKTLEDAVWLQAGLFWCNFCQSEIAKATKQLQAPVLDPYDEELQAFRAIDAMIERVGGE